MQDPVYLMQWFTRRSGVIRGPFSAEEITRHLLLGRICTHDEISQDRTLWQPAAQCAGLLPPELQKLNSWEDYQQLVIARMQVDERKGERRYQDCKNHGRYHPERRSHVDRRSRDNDRLVSHYLFGQSHSSKHFTSQQGNTRPLLLTLLLVSVVFAWLLPLQR